MSGQPNRLVYDSPRGWVAKHVRRYVETEGRQGHRWSGVDTLLLTTVGRTTAKLRRTALIYGRVDNAYIVVASNGGNHRHPDWYQNLCADPGVWIQVGASHDEATARVATENRSLLWEHMISIWPDYTKYQRRTERAIPVVIITPT